MSPRDDSNSSNPILGSGRGGRWVRRGVAVVVLLVVVGVVLASIWNTFYKYVPPGKMLVIISKNGKPLRPGYVLAEPDEKGVQKTVLGEGWHWITPIQYETELQDDVVVEPGMVGLVTQLGGDKAAGDSVLVDKDSDQGIRRQVLPPGRYRINPHGFKVDAIPAVEIKPGYVGVRQRLVGKDGAGRFAERDDEMGVLHAVLQPGTYYLNPREYTVTPFEVGVYQKTYHYFTDPKQNTAITFQARDGNIISMDCTIEWEVDPAKIAELFVDFESLDSVEKNVIDQNARRISRDRGFNYGAQDFLEGVKREKFQKDFEDELGKACEKEHVKVLSAYIRNIVIPEPFLKQQRDNQIAVETKTTTEIRTKTQESENATREEQKKIDQKDQETRATTKKLVAAVDQERENIESGVDAQLKALQSSYAKQMAQLDAERTKATGDAKNEATKMKETATSSIHKMKLDVFQNDGAAYLRYTLADQLNKDVVLRLFHTGPGTFWTNLGDKNMTLMLPVGGATPPSPPDK